MDNFALFVAGLAITMIASIGVATSTVVAGYKKKLPNKDLGEIKI